MKTSVPIVPPTPPGGWDGWRRWQFTRPSDQTMVEAWHESWEGSSVIEPSKMDPAMNIYNLYWRPVADGGEPVH